MRPRLLLADESPGVHRVIEQTITADGIEVVVARSGAEAIAMAEALRPDILLIDVAMRDPDGAPLSAVVAGRAGLSRVPVVLLSDGPNVLDPDCMRQAGGDGVLIRPLDPPAALRLVRTLLARSHATVDLPASGDVAPEEAAPGGHAEPDPLDAYFNRLDAAFAAFAAAPTARAEGADQHPAGPREPVDGIPRDGHDASGQRHESHPSTGETERWEPSFGNAFVSMFAPESTEQLPAPALALPDDLIDEIVRRVVARLGDESMRRLVIDTAERMVREEIERIKRASGAGPAQAAG
jgi:CheY-like chemotaxis protein